MSVATLVQPSLFDAPEPIATAERKPVYKGERFRLYPTEAQKVALDRQFGCCRFVYNWALDYSTWMYREHGVHTFRRDWDRLLPELKRYLPWLMEGSNSQSLKYSLKHLEAAYTRFFRKAGGRPRFKSKDGPQALTVPQFFRLDTVRGRLSLPKIRDIPIIISRAIIGTVRSITVSRTATGKYFASILYDAGGELPMASPSRPEDAIGIDLGLKHFATFSTGEKIENPRFYEKAQKRLRRLNRSLSRKRKGSKNRTKARLVLALHHERTTNRRADFLHKLTNRLTRENQAGTICVETLNVAGMVRNRHLARSISSASWGEFVRQLKYKAAWYGKNLLRCGQFDASSKLCSECGAKNEGLTLNVRGWTCAGCGVRHDRDVNAARNVVALAFQAMYPEDAGDLKPVERKALAVARAAVKPSSAKQESQWARP